MALSIEAQSRIIATLVKEQLDKLDLPNVTDLMGQIADLKKEVAILRDGVPEQILDITRRLDHAAACDEARAKEIVDVEERIAKLGEGTLGERVAALEEANPPTVEDVAKETIDYMITNAELFAGEPGKSVDHDEIVKELAEKLQVDELQIDLAVTKALDKYDLHAELAEMIPAPVKGEDGIDRPIVDIQTVSEGERIEKGTMVTHKGGLWWSTRKSKGTPDEDVASYMLAVRGVDTVSVSQEDERTVRFITRYTDGEESVQYINLHTVEHKGLWKIGEIYDINDEVALNGGTYRSVAADNEDRPGDSGTWKTVAQRGKTGKGTKGDSVKGDPGRGIKEMLGSVEGNTLMLAVMYTDDTEEIIEVPIVGAEGDDE